jgi:hypothetical protein
MYEKNQKTLVLDFHSSVDIKYVAMAENYALDTVDRNEMSEIKFPLFQPIILRTQHPQFKYHHPSFCFCFLS